MRIKIVVQELCKTSFLQQPESLFLNFLESQMAAPKQYRGTTWRAIVRRAGHRTVSKTHNTKREAEIWQANEEAKIGLVKGGANRVKRDKALTISLFQRYLEEEIPKKRGYNASTIHLRLMRDCPFMQVPMDQLTPEMIRDWRDLRVKEVAPASVNRELNSISGVFTHAIKEWSAPLAFNPCGKVTWFKNADKPRIKRWPEVSIKKLLKSLDWNETNVPVVGRDYVGWAFLLAIETAMREGELCVMTVENFHPKQKYVYLPITKNSTERYVPLSPSALKYIQHLCKGKQPEDKIFPMVANTLCQYFKEATVAAGIEGLTFHDTRHEAATRLSKKLVNVLELAAVTGHRSLKSLQRYYNPTPLELAAKLR